MRFSIEDGLQYRNDKTVTVSSNRSELITLRIDALDVTNGYKFIAEGLSGLRFRNESQLRVQLKNHSILIQTDKAIYKPGETIKFRILVLDDKLRPVALATNDRFSIHITDSEKNRIRQWINVETTKGVFTSEIQLSEQPVLGDWTISAKIGNEVNAFNTLYSTSGNSIFRFDFSFSFVFFCTGCFVLILNYPYGSHCFRIKIK